MNKKLEEQTGVPVGEPPQWVYPEYHHLEPKHKKLEKAMFDAGAF